MTKKLARQRSHFDILTQAKGRYDSLLAQERKLTVSKARRIVVDVAQVDGDSGGASQTPLVAPHVSGLEDNMVLVLCLPVHLWHSGADDTCRVTRGG